METKSPYGNLLEAFSVGAMDAISLAAGIAANLVAFIALVRFGTRPNDASSSESLEQTDRQTTEPTQQRTKDF